MNEDDRDLLFGFAVLLGFIVGSCVAVIAIYATVAICEALS